MNKKKNYLNLFINIDLILLSLIISISFTEFILSLLKYPKEIPLQITHPKNYSEYRNNIEFNYYFRTNSLGFRDKERLIKNSENKYRIFVAGDSFTEGFGVDEEKRFTNLLEQDEVEFINGGLAGTGILKYGKAFLNEGIKYNPDALLICYNLNDLTDMPLELPENLFYTIINRNGVRKIIHSIIPRIYTQIKMFKNTKLKGKQETKLDFLTEVTNYADYLGISKSKVADWIRSIPDSLITLINEDKFNGHILSRGLFYSDSNVDIIEFKSSKIQIKWNNTTKALSELIEEANKRNIEVGIILIPASFQYDINTFDQDNPTIIGGSILKKEWLLNKSQIQINMENWCKSNDINFLDLTSTFRKQIQIDKKSYNFVKDGHWNNLGHKVASDAIINWIKKEKLFFLNNNI